MNTQNVLDTPLVDLTNFHHRVKFHYNAEIVTQSGNTGLIAYLKVSRNTGFKYLVCCSSPMVEAMCTKFSHVLHQFLTLQSIHCASS